MPNDLKLLIQAGHPLIAIETIDERRAMDLVGGVAKELSSPLYEWSMTSGLIPIHAGGRQPAVVEAGKIGAALKYIGDIAQRTIFVFKDIGPHTKDARVHRTIRDLLRECSNTRSTFIFIDALPLPDEMKRFAIRYDVPWPTSDELKDVVRDTFKQIRSQSLYKISAKMTKRDMEHVVQSLRGLNCDEARRVVASAIYDDYALNADDLPRIVEAKRTLLGSMGCLEAIAADIDADDVGGLTNLKSWLRQRRGGFTQRAHEYGLEPPRGVLMLGVPGCGKSLCAKMVASDWRMPLLRLDPGVLYQKFIGESESQLRQALRQAEAMAPVVLWIDEIEKAFASASASTADGGLSKRMFGTLLSWMQDHRHPIFIIATANDISALPPELMRKGRFDEVFFIDLPGLDARKQILSIHLRRKKRDPDNFDVASLAKAAEGFTGSELEQAVMSALFAAYTEEDELADRHIREEIAKTRPLSVLMSERIAELRRWSEDRCVSAD